MRELVRSKCGQGGRGSKKSENIADIIPGSSLSGGIGKRNKQTSASEIPRALLQNLTAFLHEKRADGERRFFHYGQLSESKEQSRKQRSSFVPFPPKTNAEVVARKNANAGKFFWPPLFSVQRSVRRPRRDLIPSQSVSSLSGHRRGWD